MIITNKEVLKECLSRGDEYLRHPFKLKLLQKFKLFLTGDSSSGIELFGMWPMEMVRGVYLRSYRDIINYAVSNDYRVFVLKEGRLFENKSWFLEFAKYYNRD